LDRLDVRDAVVFVVLFPNRVVLKLLGLGEMVARRAVSNTTSLIVAPFSELIGSGNRRGWKEGVLGVAVVHVVQRDFLKDTSASVLSVVVAL